MFRRSQCVVPCEPPDAANCCEDDEDEEDEDDEEEEEGGDNDEEEEEGEEEVGDVGEVGEQSGVDGPAELSREGKAEKSGTLSGVGADDGWPWSKDSERCGMAGGVDDDEPDCDTTCVVDVDRSVPPFSLSFPFSAFFRCFVRIRWLSLTAADAAPGDDSPSHSTLAAPSSRLLV